MTVPGATPTDSVMVFLEGLQEAQAVLTKVHGQFSADGAGSIKRVFNLSGRPYSLTSAGVREQYRGSLAMGLIVVGRDGREYDLGADLMWDGDDWTISTEAWVSDDVKNQVLVKALPRRKAKHLAACIAALQDAVGDLASFRDVVLRG